MALKALSSVSEAKWHICLKFLKLKFEELTAPLGLAESFLISLHEPIITTNTRTHWKKTAKGMVEYNTMKSNRMHRWWCRAWCESAIEKQIQHTIWKIIFKNISVRIQVLSFLSFHGCFSLLELPWLKYEAMKAKLKNSRHFLTERRTKCKRKTKSHIAYSYIQATLTVITGLYLYNTLKSEGKSLIYKRTVEQIIQGTLYEGLRGKKSS